MGYRVAGRELAGLFPDARFRVIPGADHLVQHDAPATVAVEIAAFLFGQTERLELR